MYRKINNMKKVVNNIGVERELLFSTEPLLFYTLR